MRILRMKDLPAKVGMGRSTIFRRINAGTFPKPFRIGGGVISGWLERDIDAWILEQSCAMQSDNPADGNQGHGPAIPT